MAEKTEHSVTHTVYEQIRSAILEGRYRPNQRLVETELAETHHASRTPIRESLQRLQVEGLVDVRRRGWIVREHTPSEIRDVYDVRIALESYAARLAAERASDDAIAELLELNAGLTVELALQDRGRYVEVHDRFHDAIFNASSNSLLREQIIAERAHPYNRRIAGRYSEEDLKKATIGHNQIVEAISNRDGPLVGELMKEHLELAREVTLAYMDF